MSGPDCWIQLKPPVGSVFGMCVAVAVAAAPASGEDLARVTAANSALGVRSSNLLPLRIDTGPDQLVTTSVVLDGRTRTLLLRPYTLRSARFQVLVQTGASGDLTSVKPPSARTYRGTVADLPGAIVTATIVDSALTATVRLGSTVWGIQPAAKLGLSATRDHHVVYRAADWTNPTGRTCATHQGRNSSDETQRSEAATASVSTGVLSTEIAIDTDVEFFQLNKSSVQETILDVETTMNAVAQIFEQAAQINYEVTTIVIRTTEPDPYETTDADALFCAFRTQWNTGAELSIPRDVAHLFTGKNLDASTIGVSRFATICNKSMIDPFGCPGDNVNLAYGVSQSHFSPAFTARVALVAHELAHSWNASHCDGQSDCHIMCSTLGACAGIEGTNLRFNASAADSIATFRDSRLCLTDVLTSQPTPFTDQFPSTVIDASKWSFNNGTAVTADAVDAPSDALSLELNAANGGEFGGDEIRSNTIALDRAEAARCSYATQHRGVDVGESLLVEYWNSDLTWKLLNRIESDGVDQAAFVLHSHTLPDDARHASFRLRFRANVSDSSDDWYVDDVAVVETCSDDAVCQDDLYCNGQEQCVENVCQSGPEACAAADECEEHLRACRDAACSAPQIMDVTNRYLTISVVAGPDRMALLVAPACDLSAAKYVGQPSAEGFALLEDDASRAARLSADQWGGVVHVAGRDIVPETNYLVWTECMTGNTRVVSPPTGLATTLWGDITGGFDGNVWIAPDNVVNVGDDILAIIQSFQHVSSAPSLRRADLLGLGPACTPDLSIDLRDILQSVSGFQGLSYATATSCPDPCH